MHAHLFISHSIRKAWKLRAWTRLWQSDSITPYRCTMRPFYYELMNNLQTDSSFCILYSVTPCRCTIWLSLQVSEINPNTCLTWSYVKSRFFHIQFRPSSMAVLIFFSCASLFVEIGVQQELPLFRYSRLNPRAWAMHFFRVRTEIFQAPTFNNEWV